MRAIFFLPMLVLLVFPVRAAEFYVDPVAGDMSNNGSAEYPWRTLQEVVEAGLIESHSWAELPYSEGSQLVIKNQGAPIKAGDTVFLRNGYHGELVLQGYYNGAPITIAAEPGQSPQLRRILVSAGAQWIFAGLTISPEYAPNFEAVTMVSLENHSWHGPIHDVQVQNCVLQSVGDASNWNLDDWNTRACDGIRVDGTNMTIRDNQLRNVDFGISVNATHSLIEGNVVENFAGDGLRGLGDYTVFQYNTIKNCYDVNENHDDGFQSWSVGEEGVGSGEVVGIVLRGNIIINYEEANQPFRGSLQGIGCFDGFYVDWIIENNLVITDHWHGITLLGAKGCRIINNTVMDINEEEPGPPWVRIGPAKDGTPSSDSIVRNNLTTAINVDETPDITVDHNLLIITASELFVDPMNFDLHLKEGAAAIDSGSSELAPSFDIEKNPRPQGAGFDVGAYEFVPITSSGDAGIDAGVDADGYVDTDADVDADNGNGGTDSISDSEGLSDQDGYQDPADNDRGEADGPNDGVVDNERDAPTTDDEVLSSDSALGQQDTMGRAEETAGCGCQHTYKPYPTRVAFMVFTLAMLMFGWLRRRATTS